MMPIRVKCLECGSTMHTKVGWLNVTHGFAETLRERGDAPEFAERGEHLRGLVRLRHLRHVDLEPEDPYHCYGRLGLASAAETKQHALPVFDV